MYNQPSMYAVLTILLRFSMSACICEWSLQIVSDAYFYSPVKYQNQNQDQDSLLVKRRNENHSPGPVIRELVPSSHQRSELNNTILCIFSRWDQRIGEGIPISDSLGEEATFIKICISNGSLKCHRVLISTTPIFGDKVICWPLRPLYSNIDHYRTQQWGGRALIILMHRSACVVENMNTCFQ